MGLTPEIKAKLTSADHAVMGAIAGTVEVTTLQPIIFVKYAVQEGRALPRNPLHYYRGFACNVGTFAPITATQFGASRLTESLIRKYMQRDITQLDTIGECITNHRTARFGALLPGCASLITSPFC